MEGVSPSCSSSSPLVDLRAAGLEDVADELQAAITARGLDTQQHGNAPRYRFKELKQALEVDDLCFNLLQQHTCSRPSSSNHVQALQQKLWGRQSAAARELVLLHEQQREQLDTLGSKHQGLRREHQVLRSNLRSLKLTVQQLLSDVSTLLQHTASTRQQQQDQEEQQQHAASVGTAAGLTHTRLAPGGSTGHTSNGRRCVSEDGGTHAAGAGGGAGAGGAGLTMQRLIASIERMSRFFQQVDSTSCSSGSSSNGGSGGADPTSVTNPPPAAAVASAAEGSARRSSAVRAAASSKDSSVQQQQQQVAQPHSATTATAAVPRPPPLQSSSGSTARRPGVRVPGTLVLDGVATAAAAISTAMQNASAASSQPGSGRPNAHRRASAPGLAAQAASSTQQQQQVQQAGVAAAEPPAKLLARSSRRSLADAAMRHSFDTHQAKAAADAWFAQTVRSSGSLLRLQKAEEVAQQPGSSSSILGSKSHKAAAGAAGAAATGTVWGSNSSGGCGSAGNSRPGSANSSQQQQGARQRHQQQQQVTTSDAAEERHSLPAAAASCSRGEAAAVETVCGAGAAGLASQPLVQEASSGSSSLGPSISEVWRDSSSSPVDDTTAAPAAGSAATHCSSSRSSSQPERSGRLAASCSHNRPPAAGKRGHMQQYSRSRSLPGSIEQLPPSGSGNSRQWRASLASDSSHRQQQQQCEGFGPLTAGRRPPSGPLTAALHNNSSTQKAHTSSSSKPEQQGQRQQHAQWPESSEGAGGSLRSASSCSQHSNHNNVAAHSLLAGAATAARAASLAAGAAAASPSRSSIASDAVLMGSAANSPAGKGGGSLPNSPALRDASASEWARAGSTMTSSAHEGAEQQQQSQQQELQAMPPKAVRSLDMHTQRGSRAADAQAATPSAAGAAVSAPPQPSVPPPQSALSTARTQVGLLSPIVEEASGLVSSCNTTPRTSTSDVPESAAGAAGAAAPVRAGSSKLRSVAVVAAAQAGGSTAGENVWDAVKQGGRADSPKQGHRHGDSKDAAVNSRSQKLDTSCVGCDRAQPDTQQGQEYSSPAREVASSAAGSVGSRDGASCGSSHMLLLTHPLSCSLESLRTDSPDSSAGPEEGAGTACSSEAASGTLSAPAAGPCVLDLQDLLAIVLDVMHDKRAADKRYLASGLLQPTLGRHLQCYVAAKVHSNQAAYRSAMSAILTGLEQHKQVQPEIAVFCRVLSDEVDEDDFTRRHLKLRQQLQHLATHAALASSSSSSCRHQDQQLQEQEASGLLWEECCSMPLQEVQLQAMLAAWAAQRRQLLGSSQQQAPPESDQVAQLVASWQHEIRQHCGCGAGEAVRAGSAVAALLLWELRQQLLHLQPLANAFRAADAACQGVVGPSGFKRFCVHLNPAMTEEEAEVLWCEELKGQQHEQVTFTAICRALLPAM